ncbi:Nif3-like dinuclear metal center hexameric protein [soil metagenome]
MSTVRDVLEGLEGIAPKRFAFSFDKVGLQVGDSGQYVGRAVVALDRSLGAVDFAAAQGADLLLTHHPLIFTPIDSVNTASHTGRTITKLIKHEISFIAAHTNWDSAQGGINDTLCDIFGLSEVSSFGSGAKVKQLQLVTYCPPDCSEVVIRAASDSGAGLIGRYSGCAFKSAGEGRFLPIGGSNPTIGELGQMTKSGEDRIEMVLPFGNAGAVERAIRKVHPYETAVIQFLDVHEHAEQPAGRVGVLPKTTTLAELSALVEDKLSTKCWAWGDRSIHRVAVVGGSACDEWRAAQRAGADVLRTGEVKQHNALEAAESGMAIIAAGHYATEHPGCETLRKRMQLALPSIDWLLFTPNPGQNGRPI